MIKEANNVLIKLNHISSFKYHNNHSNSHSRKNHNGKYIILTVHRKQLACAMRQTHPHPSRRAAQKLSYTSTAQMTWASLFDTLSCDYPWLVSVKIRDFKFLFLPNKRFTRTVNVNKKLKSYFTHSTTSFIHKKSSSSRLWTILFVLILFLARWCNSTAQPFERSSWHIFIQHVGLKLCINFWNSKLHSD